MTHPHNPLQGLLPEGVSLPTAAQDLTLSADQQAALETLLHTPDHVFLTGAAGSGKTTVLRRYMQAAKAQGLNVAVLAYTGVAAQNAGGQTVHSFFGWRPGQTQEEMYRPRLNGSVFVALDVLVVDEVSMLRADLLDHMDQFLRRNRPGKRKLPFGGVRMVLVGDLMQLPPVVDRDQEALLAGYASRYFFDAHAWQAASLRTVTLTQVHRQADPVFLALLNRVRNGEATAQDFDRLNERYRPAERRTGVADGRLSLCAYVGQAERVNKSCVDQLRTQERTYLAETRGTVPTPNQLSSPQELRLRVGAQVMVTRNAPDASYVNGTLAVVTELHANCVTVRPLDAPDTEFTLRPVTWHFYRYEVLTPEQPGQKPRLQSRLMGSFTQVPLRLGYAVSVHKSQGLTLRNMTLDLPRTFDHGMLYTALSRLQSLEGLSLYRPLRPDMQQMDPKVLRFNASQLDWRPRPAPQALATLVQVGAQAAQDWD